MAGITNRKMDGCYYAVAEIATGTIVYSGRSAASCAAALEPGTCYVKEGNRTLAEWRASQEAERLRNRSAGT